MARIEALLKLVFVALALVGPIPARPLSSDDNDNVFNEENEKNINYERAHRMAVEAFHKLQAMQLQSPEQGHLTTRDDLNGNQLLDMALDRLREIIRQKNLDRLPIPVIEEKFTRKIIFVTIEGSFKGEDGWLESTLTIARKGDATVHLGNSSVGLDANLGLKTLRIGMKYTARLAFIKIDGDVDVRVNSNAASFAGALDYTTGKCRILLQRFRFTDLSKIQVKVSGLGPLNWLYSKIVTWITAGLQGKIRDGVENKVRQLIEEEIAKLKCPFGLDL